MHCFQYFFEKIFCMWLKVLHRSICLRISHTWIKALQVNHFLNLVSMREVGVLRRPADFCHISGIDSERNFVLLNCLTSHFYCFACHWSVLAQSEKHSFTQTAAFASLCGSSRTRSWCPQKNAFISAQSLQDFLSDQI